MVSEYGEGIINRLHPDSPLRQEGNPARTLIMKTIGKMSPILLQKLITTATPNPTVPDRLQNTDK